MRRKHSDNYGGQREGAGRKKGGKNKKTIEQQEALKILRERVLEEWGELIDKKMELAKGIYVMKPVRRDGEVVDLKVYKKAPDGNSLEYLFSMLVGKPKENLELSGGLTNKVELTDEQLEQIITRRTKGSDRKKSSKGKAD